MKEIDENDQQEEQEERTEEERPYDLARLQPALSKEEFNDVASDVKELRVAILRMMKDMRTLQVDLCNLRHVAEMQNSSNIISDATTMPRRRVSFAENTE